MTAKEIKHLLTSYSSLKLDAEKHKVTCSFTKHEMPATLAAIESYVKGKKFKNAAQKQTYDFNQYKPHIVPSTKKKHLHELFCTLTLRHISKTPQDVERHVKGKRYTKALARWKKCQETGEKFVPRQGGRKPTKTATSDSDSVGGGDSFWSDDNDDDKHGGSDDMSDLYPAEDFDVASENSDDDDGQEVNGDVPRENKPPNSSPTKVTDVNSDSDSDYDMGVLDTQKAKGQQTKSSSSSQLSTTKVEAKKNKKKNKKKRKTPLGQNDKDVKIKKKRVT